MRDMGQTGILAFYFLSVLFGFFTTELYSPVTSGYKLKFKKKKKKQTNRSYLVKLKPISLHLIFI